MNETVNIIGTQLFALDIASATQILVEGCANEDRLNLCISATGAHGLVLAKKDPKFAAVLKNFYLNLPDGMPAVWIGRLKGKRKMSRCYGPDFFKSVMIATAGSDIKHFLCGGLNGVADQLKDAVGDKFNNHNVVGTYCPPFLAIHEYNYADIAKLIDASKPNILWIGISTPKQELFANCLSSYLNCHFIITVGAAFDFHTDRIRQAPSLIQKMGLEWFFRLIMEPKRLFRRYFEIVPLFIYLNFKEFLNFAVQKK